MKTNKVAFTNHLPCKSKNNYLFAKKNFDNANIHKMPLQKPITVFLLIKNVV